MKYELLKLKNPFLILLSIILIGSSSFVFSQDDDNWEESETDIEYLAGESKKEMQEKFYYTNGDVKSGYFSENKNVYATFTLYKGNSYAFSIGAADNADNLKGSLYGNNFVDKIFSEVIEIDNYKVFYFTPEKSGTYYLKVESNEDKDSDSEWMYYYGFKQTKK
ncbi:MAG: hypothetical protein PF638_14465 [Candidatus Delongbacteria bacterium]|jgi:hypothetical protein|nr:hypothetical protein [Candidatus Delongbacteria bacterium]